jgi:origin recognition complex subunit 3
MSHFFANPISVLLAGNIPATINNGKLCEAIRNVPSFRKYARYVLFCDLSG